MPPTSATSAAATAAPSQVDWLARRGSTETHAFGGPGWMRSVCRREQWTAALRDAAEGDTRCDECVALMAGAIPESELRLLDGNR